MKENFPKSDGYQFPVRTDIEVIQADAPKQKKLGIICYEKVGVGVVNTRGLASLRKSSSEKSEPAIKTRKTRLSDNER